MEKVEELEKRFHEIKEMAWRKEELPRYQGEDAYSCVDEHYFQTMRHVYARYRLHCVRKDVAEQEVNKYRLCYIRDKTSEKIRAKGYRECQEKRIKASEWSKQLIKCEDLTVKDIFKLVFCELIPALTDDVTGRKIKEGAGYALMTGVLNLNEEERKELDGWLQ